MDVESAVGYQSNAQLQFDIMERVEGNYFDCTFMYGYSEKKANEEPPRKRRRLNNNTVYCNTGYVSITSMTMV